MLAIILLTLLSLFAPVFGFNKSAISTALSNAVPALIVLLVLVVLASPFAYFTVHRLHLEVNRAHRRLHDSQATVKPLSQGYILRASQITSLQDQTRDLFARCSLLEPQAKAAETLAADNKSLEAKLNLSLATIEELKSDITAMTAQQARIADDAWNFKDMLDDAIQQRLIFERRAQLSDDFAMAQVKRTEVALDKIYELECHLEEKDAELYDTQRRAKKVDSLEGWVKDLDEENKALRHLVLKYQAVAGEKNRIIQELEEQNEIRAVRLEASKHHHSRYSLYHRRKRLYHHQHSSDPGGTLHLQEPSSRHVHCLRPLPLQAYQSACSLDCGVH